MNDLQRIKPIFSQALDKQGPDREAYLDQACAENPDLKTEIEALLEAHEGAGDFLKAPVFDTEATLNVAPVTEGPGTVIGRYKLLEKVGEGGMAVVYMAEQTRPMQRKVALKIIKLGMDTKQVIARFEAERQALAMMDHPNIAKVFDAGSTEAGRPYFVMELVRGVSITEYCDKNKLSTRERLELFVKVCSAVQHAHQKGIIHRDIKPSNVMVRLDDEKPAPKVIDFGIAKATNQRLTEKTLLTRQAQIIGTPAYMSPEQAEMSGLDVDTRTDIYSLGVLLYELLTGTTPFDGERLRSAGYLELQRIIREEDPTRPSTKLISLSDRLGDIARHRNTKPDVLAKSIRGDLDWIVMKALEKDRTRRYETAHALAEDIQRHLRNEPILARRPSVVYRLQKFSRRHRYKLAVAAVILVLAIGVVVSVVEHLDNLKVEWARREALPMVAKLVERGDYLAAFFLAKQAEKYIPEDPILAELWPEISRPYSVRTDPGEAEVYYKEYTDLEGQWLLLGRSPLEDMTFPVGLYRWKIVKEGYEPRECVAGSPVPGRGNLRITLHPHGNRPNMVPIDSQQCGTFLIDKYEVTNEQYKEFVDRGGYEKQEYWKHPFVKDGRDIPWEEAMGEFRDKTGRPGPAEWEGGAYPNGQDKFPVAGVSWYEAAAYAEFAGKSLPTVSHWYEAAYVRGAGVIIPYSNFGEGPAAVGSHKGMSLTGLYDMAGNVREWCFNAVDDSGSRHYILGGSWIDPEYMFGLRNTAPPWDRSERNGFRCACHLGGELSISQSLLAPMPGQIVRDLHQVPQLAEEEFRSCKALYSYDRNDLEERMERVDENSAHWRKEKITFNAAYGNERMTAYLFLPKNGTPPFQPMVFFPTVNAFREADSENIDNTWEFRALDFIIKSGRAVLCPVYKGTYERRPGQGNPNPTRAPVAHRSWFVQMHQDMARSIDYLESRDDVDLKKLTYLGNSWGGTTGPLWVSLENRIHFAIFVDGGCSVWQDAFHPMADPARFVGHVKVPTIMLNGIYDNTFPYELSQKPTFELLGTPAEHKVHKTYPGGHGITGLFRKEFTRDVLGWLDRYLEPVNGKRSDSMRKGERKDEQL